MPSNCSRTRKSIHERFSYFSYWLSFLFTSQPIFLLNCGDNFYGLSVGFLVPHIFRLFKSLQITVLLRPKASEISFWDFLTLFWAVISLFWNTFNLVPLTIYVFRILSFTVLIAFILRRRYRINVLMTLSPFFFLVFIGGLIFMSKINFKI